MSRRRAHGKAVTGVELGFIFCQGSAGMIFLGILMQFIAAKTTFEAGVEYQPVTITWLVLFMIFQIPAIFFKIKVEKKKRLIKTDKKAYEERVRQDIQKNREMYHDLYLAIDGEKVFAVMEPLRIRICKNQKKIDKLYENIRNNDLALISKHRYHKLRDKLDEDNTAFYLEYKKNIAEPVLEQFLEEFQYKPSQGFSRSQLSDFRFFSGINVDTVHSEDYIEGVYKGVGYRQADVQQKKRLNASDLYNEADRLHGRIFIYHFKKTLNGDIVIKTQNSPHVDVRGMEKVEMENMLFNSKFDVYTTNEHIAYYLLTPQFMEYLLRLNVRGETAFRFFMNNIEVLRNGVNGIFEADMSKPLDLQYEIGKSYNELKEILDFVDVLNLDKVADEANLRAMYSKEESSEERTIVLDEGKSSYGVVDIEDSVFGGLAFEEAGNAQDIRKKDDLENWNKPAPPKTGSSGLKLKL